MKSYGLAAQNKLKEPAVLEQQVARMIADPRSAEFVSGFVHQWLHMERLDFFSLRPFIFNDLMKARERLYVKRCMPHSITFFKAMRMES